MERLESVWVGRFTLEGGKDAFRKAIDSVGPNTDQHIDSIAIKISVCEYRSPETGAITHPLALACLLDELHERYPKAVVTIIENDATTIDMASAFRLLGFDAIAARHGARLLNVADGEWIMKQVPEGRVLTEFEIPAVLENCDLFINFAKLKTNALTKTTGCLKNIFGLLRTKRKVVYHDRINQVLVDMNKVIRPDLCLVDGYIGMEGMGGPAFGIPKRCELLIAGSNPVATDACCARIMGFPPRTIQHIKLCHQAGLGPLAYRLSTDIPTFDYRRYRFDFNRSEYALRNLIRSRAGFAL